MRASQIHVDGIYMISGSVAVVRRVHAERPRRTWTVEIVYPTHRYKVIESREFDRLANRNDVPEPLREQFFGPTEENTEC